MELTSIYKIYMFVGRDIIVLTRNYQHMNFIFITHDEIFAKLIFLHDE